MEFLHKKCEAFLRTKNAQNPAGFWRAKMPCILSISTYAKKAPLFCTPKIRCIFERMSGY